MIYTIDWMTINKFNNNKFLVQKLRQFIEYQFINFLSSTTVMTKLTDLINDTIKSKIYDTVQQEGRRGGMFLLHNENNLTPNQAKIFTQKIVCPKKE